MADTMTLEQVRSNMRDAMNSVLKDDTRRMVVDWYNAIDAAIKQRERDKQDAARYRWLRKQHNSSIPSWHVRSSTNSIPLDLDIGLDAEMEKESAMADLETLRPEVQAAMRELREALRVQGVGSHGPQFTIIRAELLRLAGENARLLAANRDCVAHFETMQNDLAALKTRIAEAPVVEIANFGDPFIVLPDHLTIPNSLKSKLVRLLVEE